MRSVILCAFIALSACAPKLIAGNEAGGMVSVRGSTAGQRRSMEIADADCRKFGKVAKYGSRNEWHGTVSYECVAK